jgi:hypothetical protein
MNVSLRATLRTSLPLAKLLSSTDLTLYALRFDELHQGTLSSLNDCLPFSLFCEQLGRPVVLVQLKYHSTKKRNLEETKKLCVYQIDRALQRLYDSESSSVETVVTVFDLDGFNTDSFDLDFLRFFAQAIFDYFPKRVSQVLLVDAPMFFKPMWSTAKPLLGTYGDIATFVNRREARSLLGSDI